MIDVNTTQEVTYHDDPQHYANIIARRYVLVSTIETLIAYNPTDATCQATGDRKVPSPVTLSLPWRGFPSHVLVHFYQDLKVRNVAGENVTTKI
ncbi:hypothetical protein HanIR_Chr16g0791321 [Helianthus annuus]|nr:hypothetical protein HanIR_Chr16g0791321 [Helianthus annuus]